jgi:hypothetical protein
MSLTDWLKDGWLRPHQTNQDEISRLFDVIERDLRVSGDANVDEDWRFVAAYNAALQCAAVALYASGFEAPKGGGAHHRTIESLALTTVEKAEVIDALQAFRAKRAGAVYEMIGIASSSEIRELRESATKLRDRVRDWLKRTHPELLASEKQGRGRRDRR